MWKAVRKSRNENENEKLFSGTKISGTKISGTKFSGTKLSVWNSSIMILVTTIFI
jgi:hypothetical protein